MNTFLSNIAQVVETTENQYVLFTTIKYDFILHLFLLCVQNKSSQLLKLKWFNMSWFKMNFRLKKDNSQPKYLF